MGKKKSVFSNSLDFYWVLSNLILSFCLGTQRRNFWSEKREDWNFPPVAGARRVHFIILVHASVYAWSLHHLQMRMTLCLTLLFVIFTGRIYPKGSSVGIVFTHGPIFGFFAPQGRHAAFGTVERTIYIGPPCQILPWSDQGWGFTAPKTEKMEFYQYNCP